MTKAGSHSSTCAHASPHAIGFESDAFRVSAAARADLHPGHFPDPSHGILPDDAPRCGQPGLVVSQAQKDWLWRRFADGSEKRLHEPEGKARDDGEWWREIILMLIAARLMEDYFAPGRITPYRVITRCWSPIDRALWSACCRHCHAAPTTSSAI
jgi:hypothetical protein